MRVLHIQKCTGIGGSERHLLDLIPSLRARFIEAECCVLLDADGHRFVDQLRDRSVPVHTVPAGRDASPRVVAQLRALLRTQRFDLVHTHLIHADTHGQVAARLTRTPAVSSIHSTHRFYTREPFRSVARTAGRLARRTIAISEFAALFVADNKLAPADRIRVVRYGIDAAEWTTDPDGRLRARAEFGFAPLQCVVTIASRLISGKGHDQLIRAVAASSAPNLVLAIAGDGPLRADLERLVAATGSDRVRFLGFVENISSLFAASDIAAFTTQPELSEGFGLAALEAQAAGVAVIATRVASLPEVVAEDETGLIVPPANEPALRAAVERLAGDEARRHALGAAGRERARTVFSKVKMLDATVRVYEEATT